jgi:RNA polymerase sigma factor (sigma-70 family)
MSGVAIAPRRRDDVDIERDRELVERAQAGNADAFGDLYLRYFDRLCRFCFRRLGNMSEAEDAAQESFTRAWKALPRFDGERRLYPWLSVIAANVCTDVVRRRSRSKVVDEPDLERVAAPVDGGQEAIVDRADSDLLNAALGRISPRHREVLRLRESYEWSYQRIAAYQGVEVSTIETLLFRARRSLRREFLALAEAQGALGGAVLLVLKRGIWRARHLGAPAGAAKSAVPAVAGAGAGAGGAGGAVLGAGAVAALFAVGVLTGSAMIVRHAPTQAVAASQPAASGPAALTNARASNHMSSTAEAAGGVGASSTARPARGTTSGAARREGAKSASPTSPASSLTNPLTSAEGGLPSAGSQAASKVQQLGAGVTRTVSNVVQSVVGVVRTAGGVVKSVVAAVEKGHLPVKLPPVPVTLPPVTVPVVTLPPVTLPPLG